MNKVIHRLSTIKFIFRVLNEYKKYSVAQKEKKFIKSLKASKELISYDTLAPLYPDNSLLTKLEYKNENWEVVKNRFHDRFLKYFNLSTNTNDNACSDDKIKVVDNNLYFNSTGLKDDWIYYFLNEPLLKNYELKFDAVFNSEFREIQFGFRYRDFYNRYRFRIEDGFLHFDVVRKGQFYNSLFKEQLSINVNEVYHFLIVVKDNQYSFLSNGNVILTVTDNVELFKKGAVALILWDDCGDSNIKGEFENVQLTVIV